MLKHTVIPFVLKRDGITWTGSWEDKAAIVAKAIDVLTDGVTYPNYFQNLFASYSGRNGKYQWVADHNGDLLPN